jgi:hypothetical protein
MVDLGGYDPRADDRYIPFLQGELLSQAAREDAKNIEAQRLWLPPAFPDTLYNQLAADVPEVDWVIEGLAPAGIVQVNAQAKGGKTTLLLNCAKSLATKEPFLGRFEVFVGVDERIGYLNMELPKRQILQWLSGMGISDEAAKRLELYHAIDDGFGVLDFRNDKAVKWIVDWLTSSGITVLFADPLAKLYNPVSWGGGVDPNAAYTQWFKALETVVREAELRLVFLAHHTGFSEDAADRSRGASAMMDNPTVNMAYRHNGDHAAKPLDNKRYLKAFGRDVDVDEFEIDYDGSTRRLYATGGGNRVAAAPEQWALKAYDVLATWPTGNGPIELSADDLALKAGVAPTSRRSAEFRAGRQLAVDRDWLAERKQGRTKLFRLGSIVPTSRRGGATVIQMKSS